ncbi:MAG: YihA family ribosome biogenesis GTP-binding protein [Candidatus Moraniibacteriota bacterium]|nr:MAG: YihA family ribosome biogenesis GTP-binding protein [Candidatus Moranbacteria bacterium]
MIIDVEFIKGIIGTDPIVTDEKKKIVFVGRSNVGKSSLINLLVGKKIARSSSEPGKTREINFFSLGKKRYFVDLPGYGYARISEKSREKLRKHLLWFLFESGVELELVVLIVDAQVGLKSFDEEILQAFLERKTPFVIIANKSDKLTQKEKYKALKKFREKGVEDSILWMSAKTGKGKESLRLKIFGEG